jgi:hypothetical protein
MKKDSQLNIPNNLVITDPNGYLSSTPQNSLGSNILFVTTTGDSATGQKGNVLKPFNIIDATSYASSGDTIFVLPGTYNINSSFGLPLLNGVDYYLLNPTINIIGSSNYGSIVIYDTINCKIYGKATINNQNIFSHQGTISPGADCNILIDGITFLSNNGLIATTSFNNGTGIRKLLIKNCTLISSDFSTGTAQGVGVTTRYTQVDLINCYVEGQIFIAYRCTPGQPYSFKAVNCNFKAITGTNGETGSLFLCNFNSPTDNGRVILQSCNFVSTGPNLVTGGFGGYGINAKLVVSDCKFVNGTGGWLVSNWNSSGGVLVYNLINNYSTNQGTGTDFPITNQITADAGMFIEPNLDITF